MATDTPRPVSSRPVPSRPGTPIAGIGLADSLATLSRAGPPVRPSGLGENMAASYEAVVTGDLTISPAATLDRALEERKKVIEKLTGRPYGAVFAEHAAAEPLFGQDLRSGPPDALALVGAAAARPDGGLADRAARREAVIDRIRAALPRPLRDQVPSLDRVKARADEIARESAAANADVAGRATIGGVVGQVVGAIGAGMVDPPNIASLLAGAPARAGILAKMAIEAGLGMGVEAIAQPGIQQERARVGLEAGAEQAAVNILSAGAGAAGLTAAGEVVAMAARKGWRAVEDRLGRRLRPSERAALDQAVKLAEAHAADPHVRGRAESLAHLYALDAAREDAAAGEVYRGPTPADGGARVERAPARGGPLVQLDMGMEEIRPHIASLTAFARDPKAVGNVAPKVTIGRIGPNEAARYMAEIGPAAQDFDGYSHVIDGYNVRFALRERGDARKEAAQGRIAITEDDIARVPEILADPDGIVNEGKSRQGKPVIGYWKRLEDGTLYFLEEVRTGKRELAFLSMEKMNTGAPGGRLPGAAAPSAGPVGAEVARREGRGDPFPDATADDLLRRWDAVSADRDPAKTKKADIRDKTAQSLELRGYRMTAAGEWRPRPIDDGSRDMLRYLRGTRRPPELPRYPILAMLKYRGVDPDGDIGQALRHMGVTARHPLPGLLSRKEKRLGTATGVETARPLRSWDELQVDGNPDFDLVAKAADGRIDPDRWIELIRQEMAGRPIVPAGREDDRALLDALADFDQTLHEAGVSPKDPDHEIAAALDRWLLDQDPDAAAERAAIQEVDGGRTSGKPSGKRRDPGDGRSGEGDGGSAPRGQREAEGSGALPDDGRPVEPGLAGAALASGEAPAGRAGGDVQPDGGGSSRPQSDLTQSDPTRSNQSADRAADPDGTVTLAALEAEIARLSPEDLDALRVADPSGDGRLLSVADIREEARQRERTARQIEACVTGGGDSGEAPF